MRRLAILVLLMVACVGDEDMPRHDPTGTSTVGPSTRGTSSDEPEGVDSSDGPGGFDCVDDYHGNQEPGTAHGFMLNAAGSATPVGVTFGDGLAASPVELGGDELVVCPAAPSDFFALETTCAGYLVIEVRRLEGGVPDLVLYDRSGQPLEELQDAWDGFFLKPLQRHVEAGTHVVEVRHAGESAGRYGLTVLTLPDSTCR